MSLFIAKYRNIHSDVAQCGIFANGTCSFQCINHTERTIQPTRVILGFDMRAGEHYLANDVGGAKNVANTVNSCIEARRDHALDKPLSRKNIFR